MSYFIFMIVDRKYVDEGIHYSFSCEILLIFFRSWEKAQTLMNSKILNATLLISPMEYDDKFVKHPS